MVRSARLTGTLCAILVGCSVPDSEKCLDGFLYDDDLGVCVEVEDTADTGSESKDTESGSDGGETGLGEFCTGQDQCASYDADYCLIDPMTQEGGCTIQGCPSTPCPPKYLCCTCPEGFGLPSVCIGARETSALETFGCTCE